LSIYPLYISFVNIEIMSLHRVAFYLFYRNC